MSPEYTCNKDDLFNLANEAALQAGAILKSYFGKKKDISYKGRIDLVTEVDLKSEKAIVSMIKSRYPDHDIITEETDFDQTGSPWRWIIDPLDGTVNYSHDHPLACVSIALEHEGEVKLGIVHNPMMRETFCATKGGGAFCNQMPIHVSDIDDLEKGMVVTGFPYDIRESGTNLAHFQHMIKKAQAVRRDGAAALDLCFVAMGRYEGYWEQGMAPWDVAAGGLILTEAGGKITGNDGKPRTLFDRTIVATNGSIHEELVKELQAVGD